MTQDERTLWADEIRERLEVWGNWTRGNQLVRGTRNVLADMIQRAAGEIPGADGPVGYDFTFEIEVTDKAVAGLKIAAGEAPTFERRQYLRKAKRVLMSVYLGRLAPSEIAETLNCSEDHVKSLLWFAESYVGQRIPEIEKRVAACRRQR